MLNIGIAHGNFVRDVFSEKVLTEEIYVAIFRNMTSYMCQPAISLITLARCCRFPAIGPYIAHILSN